MSELEIKRLEAEILERIEKARKIKQDYQWYPFFMGVGAFGVAIAFVKLFLN